MSSAQHASEEALAELVEFSKRGEQLTATAPGVPIDLIRSAPAA